MNIIEAIKDPNLFRPFLGDELGTWQRWFAALQVLYGLPLPGPVSRHIVNSCTGWKTPPLGGFDTALFLTGRRSGKSRIAATVAAYEGALAGHEDRLAKGERGVVAVCAPTKAQGRIVKDYMRAVFEAPILAATIERETSEGFELKTGNRIQILAGDFRTVRGFTLLAGVVDEACHFGYEAESKMSDTELVRAIKPSLATTGGKLICISSPYARKGWCWNQYKRHYGNPRARTLVWNCPSTTMNPTLPQNIIDDAMAEDLQAAKSEYLGEFRDDIASFLPREVIEALVVSGCRERLCDDRTEYVAFADLSGGRGDDAALAIAHIAKTNHNILPTSEQARNVVVDLARRWRPPFNPTAVIGEMCELLRKYRIRSVTGDNYAAEFVARAFTSNGIRYMKAEKPKSVLYIELLPRISSGAIELPDNPVLIDQLAALERRTRAGGRDIIDHPPNGHDDLANVVAGVATVAAKPRRIVGAFAL